MFVLKATTDTSCNVLSDGFYTGSTYIFHGEKYAIVDRDIDKAKKYTSLKRAENAAECMLGSIANYVFEVEEIKE